jgi:uncharacterized protein (TIGR00369 family)
MKHPFPPDPNYRERVVASFAQQSVMRLIGATLLTVEPGHVVVELPFRADLCQQNGFLHAGIITTIVDSACGYAAYTLMPADSNVLSIEFKLNLLAPAIGERFEAHGRVLRNGRTITVCTGDLLAFQAGSEKQVATMLATMMVMR